MLDRVLDTVGVAAFFVAIVDCVYIVRRVYREKLLDVVVPASTVPLQLEQHLTVKLLVDCSISSAKGLSEPVALRDVISLLHACEGALAWTGVLPIICYTVSVLCHLGRNQLSQQLHFDVIVPSLFLTGFLIQCVHYVLSIRTGLFDTLFKLGLWPTPYPPLIDLLLRKVLGEKYAR